MFTSAQITQMMANQQQASFMTNMQSQALTQRMVGGGVGGSLFSPDPTESAAGAIGLMGGIGRTAMAPLGFANSLPGFATMMAGGWAAKKGMLGAGGLARLAGLGGRAVTAGFGLPMLGVTLGLEAAGKGFMEGAGGYLNTSRFVNQWNRQMGTGAGGSGFSQQDKTQVYQTIKGLSQMKELGGDINKALDFVKTYRDAGLMENVRNAKQFSKRFGELMKSTNEIVKTLGASMKSAQQMVIELDKIGITGKAVMGTASSLRRQADATGMSVEQIHALRAQGGEAAWQTGGFRASGYSAMGRDLELANAMVKRGALSQDMLKHTFGVGGQEGLQAAAGLMQQAGMGLAQTRFGRNLISSDVYAKALGQVEGGKYTGMLDPGLLARAQRGQLSFTQMKQLAADKYKKMGFAGQESFALMNEQIKSEMGTQIGALGWGSIAQREFLDRFGKQGTYKGKNINEAMMAFMRRTTGADPRQAAMLVNMMRNAPQAREDVMTSQYASLTEEARQSVHRRKYGSDDIGEQIKEGLKGMWSDIKDPFRSLGSSVAQSWEENRRSRRDAYYRDPKSTRRAVRRQLERISAKEDILGTREIGTAPAEMTTDLAWLKFTTENPDAMQRLKDVGVNTKYGARNLGNQLIGLENVSDDPKFRFKGDGLKGTGWTRKGTVEDVRSTMQRAEDIRSGKYGEGVTESQARAFLERYSKIRGELSPDTGARIVGATQQLGLKDTQEFWKLYSASSKYFGAGATEPYNARVEKAEQALAKAKKGTKEYEAALAEVDAAHKARDEFKGKAPAQRMEELGQDFSAAVAPVSGTVSHAQLAASRKEAARTQEELTKKLGDTNWFWGGKTKWMRGMGTDTLKDVKSGAWGAFASLTDEQIKALGGTKDEGEAGAKARDFLKENIRKQNPDMTDEEIEKEYEAYASDVVRISKNQLENIGSSKKDIEATRELAKRLASQKEKAESERILMRSQSILSPWAKAREGGVTKEEYEQMRGSEGPLGDYLNQIGDLGKEGASLQKIIDKELSKTGSLSEDTFKQLQQVLEKLATETAGKEADKATGGEESDSDVLAQTEQLGKAAQESAKQLQGAVKAMSDALYGMSGSLDAFAEKYPAPE